MNNLNSNNKRKYNCEILAPAGSYQCMIAAFNAGADAVYVGGSMFGARAYANNFDTEELITAIDYAHLRGKKLYLTVNTLLKQTEIDKQLIEYLTPLYAAGLDAVIVQDMGVLIKIHENFPDMDIHASTQMTVTGVDFALELKKLGVKRIVTPRELSYNEIRAIYDATGLEIESFIHGALCYCYSGQCLLSSMIGGRSGNRGRCAQPCRLNYDLYDAHGKVNNKNDRYLLSTKDMCTLKILPRILASGVYSLKIEGRMKKPEYVAGVVKTYRKYIDMLSYSDGYSISENDIDELKEIYNRGGFTEGFYEKQNNRDIMSLYKPNHYGVKVADILNVNKGFIQIKALKNIDSRDVLEINMANNTSINLEIKADIKKGQTAEIRCDSKNLHDIKSLYEAAVYRTRNNGLIEDIENKYIKSESQIQIFGQAIIKANEPMTLILSTDDGISVQTYGNIPDKASTRPADESAIRKQLLKTGGTDFIFSCLDIDLDEGLFVPVSSLNDLRRSALDSLKASILSPYKRNNSKIGCVKSLNENGENIYQENDSTTFIDCVVSSYGQLRQALNAGYIDMVALEISRFEYKDAYLLLDKIKKSGKKSFIALPYICRSMAIQDFDKNIDFYLSADYDGLIVRNYDEYFYFTKLYKKNNLVKKFIFDTNVYMFNNETINYFHALTEKNGNFDSIFSIPYELNYNEIGKLKLENSRMEIYGYIPVMTSAGCVRKTTDTCNHKNDDAIYLKDRLNNRMNVIANCRYCYNVIYNSIPLFLGNEIDKLNEIGIRDLSIRFSIEREDETASALQRIENCLENRHIETSKIDFTRGHFRRGVM